MVKISDEVLAFELDQPRHVTSLQISCFLQINTGYSKVGSRLYQFDPQRPPLLFPRWRLHICFCHVIFLFYSTHHMRLYLLLSTLLPKIRKSEKLFRSHTANFSTFFNSLTMILVLYVQYKLPTSRAAESLFTCQ